MSAAQDYATVAALSEEPTLVRVAHQLLDAAAAAETRTAMRDASVRPAEGGGLEHFTGGEWVPWDPPADEQVGSKVRDGAVDPRPGDIGPAFVDFGDGPGQVNAEVDSPLYQEQVDAARAEGDA